MPFKKQTQTFTKKEHEFKHVTILVGYEFKDYDIKSAKQWLQDNQIHHTDDSNIYVEDGCVMYQVSPKVYDNELTWMEYELDRNVKLLLAIYKFKHTEKK